MYIFLLWKIVEKLHLLLFNWKTFHKEETILSWKLIFWPAFIAFNASEGTKWTQRRSEKGLYRILSLLLYQIYFPSLHNTINAIFAAGFLKQKLYVIKYSEDIFQKRFFFWISLRLFCTLTRFKYWNKIKITKKIYYIYIMCVYLL